ncbi:MAG TPA: hypothetical protein VD767_10830 [Thermomicrobiales bacterium]|nr:hypothetical protein [Thermomicrobiales bacterium]
MANARNDAVIEATDTKAFASMLDWPGWCRWAKTEDGAIETLLAYAPRYQPVVELAGLKRLPSSVNVVDRVPGGGATSFGVPDKVHAIEYEPIEGKELSRQIGILRACWTFFDDVTASVSAELRKGPRGGGRNRDQIVDHVVQADRGYARQIGVKTPPFDSFDRAARDEHLEAVCAAMPDRSDGRVDGKGWPVGYFIRRAAWHILDHAWEMQDKDLTGEER